MFALQLAVTPQRHYEIAKDDLAQKQTVQADAEVDAALRLDPNFVPALLLKARLALFAHRSDVARSCLIKAITVDPKSESAQFLLGLYFYLQNDFKLALAPLEIARSLDPGAPLPDFYLGLSHDGLGEAKEALDFYGKAEALSPNNDAQRAEILVAFSRLLSSLGRYQESMQKIDLALNAQDLSRDAHYEKAKLLFRQEAYEAAVSQAEHALRLPALGTSDGQVHFLLGKIYLKLNKPEIAQKHFALFHATPQSTQR